MLSTIRGTSFEGADLINAAFSQAIISNTSFSGANLNVARFDGAQLASVDFSEADVSEASFRNVSYTALPNFEKTAWWLAVGWKRGELAKLVERYGGPDSKKQAVKGEYPKFDQQINKFQKRLDERNISALDRAVDLDGKAWTLATHGFYLEEAEKTAREAVAIIATVKEICDEEKARRMSYIMDTLAYILMQTDHLAEALELKTKDQYTKDMGGIFPIRSPAPYAR